MKTNCVRGGLGPQMPMDLGARVDGVAQRLVSGHGNDGSPPKQDAADRTGYRCVRASAMKTSGRRRRPAAD